MTQREGGPGSPEEPVDDASPDAELDQDEADLDEAPDANAADFPRDEEPEAGGIVGDANDELPSSGRTPGATSPGRGSRASRRQGGAPVRPAAAPTPSEIAVRIDDRISAAFVIVTVAFFILLFIYAVLFGGSGLLTPKPTPRPTPVPTASPAPSPSASPTAVPSVSASASAAPSASGSAAPSGSGAPSASVAPSASAPAGSSAVPGASPSST